MFFRRIDNFYSINRMKRTRKTKALLLAVTCAVILVLSSRGMISKDSATSVDDKIQQDTTRHQTPVYSNNSPIFFYGKPVILDDSTHIMQQITEIVESDTMLSIDGRELTVSKVEFGINFHSGFLSLLSSTQPDDPKMKEVIEYLNSIYGTPEEDEPDNYWWYVGADEDYLGKLVARLRPLHSEEGGTVLFFGN